jgi:S-adenosylmethionine synthetase
MAKKTFVTSESVTEGHPDKICDQVSDAILDCLIGQDPESRVAVECLVTTGALIVAGEVTTNGFADVQVIARGTLKDIGYTDPEFGIDHEDAGVFVSIHRQSPDIAMGVNSSDDKKQGAGDQGMMYGYACRETPELMPRVPKRIDAVVISTQHVADKTVDELRREIRAHVIDPICGDHLDADTKYHINPTGRFVIGGPEGDTGVTGRKIIVDTYGGVGRQGGGAFSGKDPSKVDRSAAYSARWVAKNVVAAGLADRCEVQLSYAIGVADPTSVNVDTFGTSTIPEEEIVARIKRDFDLTPAGMIRDLDLRRPIFKQTAAYGHFGREEPDFTWERTDKAELLKHGV